MFVFAIIYFSDKAFGSIGYTSQLDLSEAPIAYVQASSSLPVPSKLPQVARKGVNEVNRQLGQTLASQNGIEGQEWMCLDTLWGKNESGWNTGSQNPKSTAYGIPQFLDSTWLGTGYKKSPDPAIQIKAGLVYIKNRYITPCKALQFQVSHWPYWY